MSLPVALSVWFLLPDLPHNTQAWYITEEEKKIALRRSATQGKAQVTGKLDAALAKRMFTNWRWWTLCLVYIFVSLTLKFDQNGPRSTDVLITSMRTRVRELLCHLPEYVHHPLMSKANLATNTVL